jgi:PKD repeat protein
MRFFIILSFIFFSDLTFSQTFSFTPAPGSPIAVPSVTGSNKCLLSHDLNSDGNKDLLIGNAYDAEINIFHGIGGAQFTVAPFSPLVVGNGPQNFVLADFNNDGTKDLAISKYYTTNQMAIYNGVPATGNYTQAAGSPYTTGNQPYWIDAADFNLDGKMDVVTCNVNGGTTYVFMGNGASGFTVATGYPMNTGTQSRCVKTGYFNADNFPDYAIINGTANTLTVMLGNGAGGFSQAPGSPYTTSNGPATISIKDLNNDGASDIVVAANTLNVFLGSASGTFTQAAGSPYGMGPGAYEAAIADYDLNGTLDIAATVVAPTNQVFFLSGIGNGSFSVSSYSISGFNTPFAITADDFNNDGRPDLTVSNWVGTSLFVYLNTSTICPLSPSYNYSTGVQGAVSFTSSSTGTTALTTYSWNYGDSSGGSGAATTHTYSSNGNYTVMLTVINSTVAPACIQTYSSVVSVTNACSISQTFTYSSNAQGAYSFSSTSTGTNASTVYSWNFGDSSSGAGQITNHTYTANGTYTVSFTVVNTSTPSCFITTSAVITVTDACSIMGSFTYSTINGAFYNFNSAISGTTTGAIFNWDFGDSNTGSGPATSHQYTNNGMYTVTLTVVNLTNPPCSRTYTATLTVSTLMGLQTLKNNADLKIYPNPASDKLFVESSAKLNSQLIIYTAIGKEILRCDLKDNKSEIKLDLSPGFYYYSIKNNSGILGTGRLVLER